MHNRMKKMTQYQKFVIVIMLTLKKSFLYIEEVCLTFDEIDEGICWSGGIGVGGIENFS